LGPKREGFIEINEDCVGFTTETRRHRETQRTVMGCRTQEGTHFFMISKLMKIASDLPRRHRETQRTVMGFRAQQGIHPYLSIRNKFRESLCLGVSVVKISF
jgi:hypothetical protein